MAESRKRREPRATTTILDLHAELLYLIVKRLDQESLRSISLLSPRFVPLTSPFITELTFRDHHRLLPLSKFREIFSRFPSVNEINLKSASIARALTAIANSELNIVALRIYGCPNYPNRRTILNLKASPGNLKKVKSLKLMWFGKKVGARRMVDFIKIFPAVDELDLSSGGCWNEFGFQRLAESVPNLRRICISLNEHVTTIGLQYFAMFCKNLEHFCLDGCTGETVSPQGLEICITKWPNLRSLRLPVFSSQRFTREKFLWLANAIGSLKYLTQLAITDNMVNDDYLITIARFKLPLMSLEVGKAGARGSYTMIGLGVLLCASRSLTSLDVSLPELDLDNQDQKMSRLMKMLPCLRRIQINTLNWFHETLFSLIDNCHKLESISINGDMGKCVSEFPVTIPHKKNYSIEFICIRPMLKESLRTALISSCPLLKRLESF